jgi:hypothetical protein
LGHQIAEAKVILPLLLPDLLGNGSRPGLAGQGGQLSGYK